MKGVKMPAERHEIQPGHALVYEIVEKEGNFRVRFHRDYRRWSGKWYWLKVNGEVFETITADDAQLAIDTDVHDRHVELEGWNPQ